MSEIKATKEVTREKFEAFLDWLSVDSDKTGEEYERLRFRLITFFSQRNCLFAEDLADETINRVCLKIGTEVVEKKMAFVYAFAKNVYLESLRKEKNHQNIDEINVAEKEREVETDLSGDCLDKCLNELPAENKGLILEYFSEDKQAKIDLHRELSAKFEITQTALRMRIVRIKNALRNCLQECLTV